MSLTRRYGILTLLLVVVGVGHAPLAEEMPAGGERDLVWTEKDWSQGQYSSSAGIDPEIAPGLLVLENRLDDFRFLSQPTDWQGLWSIDVYHDTLFMAASDYPYEFHGADVIAYDYITNTYEVVYQPYESGLHLIKVLGDTLYIPGPDSRDPHEEEGSIYTYDGHVWVEKATLPTAIHVNDIELLDGRLYVTTAHATGELNGFGCVWMSEDWGDTFTRVLSIQPTPLKLYRRFFGLGRFGDRLFAQPDGDPPQDEMLFTSTDGVQWDSVYVPNLPVEKQCNFIPWGDSLLMPVETRLYIWNGVLWRNRGMPFNLARWGRGVHEYKGELYGGGLSCEIFRWLGNSQWELTGRLDADPDSVHIADMATYYGRVFLSTYRSPQGFPARFYVSAAIPSGTLQSQPHDFTGPTHNGRLWWNDFRPGAGNLATLQLRSGATLEELELESFVGPDGTPATYYEQSGTSLPLRHYGHRYFQYLVELRCPEGLWMPFLRSVTLEVDRLDPSEVPELPAPPRALGLRFDAPQPNPAQSATLLRASLGGLTQEAAGSSGAATETARIEICDLLGRCVCTTTIAADATGQLQWRWDLRDDRGHPVPAGVYRARIEVPGAVATASRSLVVLR